MNITKGIKKQVKAVLIAADFFRIGKLEFPYDNFAEDGLFIEKSLNVEIKLYVSEQSYDNKEMSLDYFNSFSMSIPINYTYAELYYAIKSLPELLYDKILENPFFENSERILIEIPDTMPVNLNLT